MATIAKPTSADVAACPILINGERRESAGRTATQLNPATGQPTSLVPECTAEEISAAIGAAQEAFSLWSAIPVLNRARILFHYHNVLEKHADRIISLVSEENGKTRSEAQGSFQRGLECVEFACGAPTLLMGETVERVGGDVDTMSVRAPLGVCAGITPFNFPFMVPLWMFPLAIVCGNAFVLKPSPAVPRSAVLGVELLYEAGLPSGVVNVVHGGKESVDAILNDPRVKAVSFVGSSPVARHIYKTAAANGKRVQALGGAKNHSIVMPDCDMKLAVDSVLSSSFGCAGERCVATSVVVAVGEAGNKFVEELKKAVDNLRVAPGDEPGCDMGPVITPEARKRIVGYIESGEKEGAKLVRDGRNDGCNSQDGFFLGPTIFDHVKPGMKIAREEIFGPVLSIVRAKDLDQALEIVNGAEQGNASSIYTKSGAAAKKYAAAVQTGMVGVNLGVPAPVAIFPFAGWKGSFFGDAHALGKDGVRFYTESKVITARWPE
jgi:malonate-semialdehyde dehydrogenase (acetylating)/methylmalonate-semialdehyde dehydrogenase